MSSYKHLLVPVDLSADSNLLITRAKTLAVAFSAKLSLIHVIEVPPLYRGTWGAWDSTDIESRIQENAKSQLLEIARESEIHEDDCYLTRGAPKLQIQSTAEEQGVDLIVIGSHGRQGVQMLLGSTANAVLHGAGCDVLAVRM